jgi:dTDP-4-dehydrorhamnose 3,5-epimerase
MYNDFKVSDSSKIKGLKIIEPDFFEDHRGMLYTDYLKDFSLKVLDLDFNHSKIAVSKKDVLRGIHGDHKSYKLVSCLYGEVFQVAVDLRKDSPTYLANQSFDLTPNKPKLILLPPGIGNAFLVLSNHAVYSYKLSYEGSYIDADDQFTCHWADPTLNIQWPINEPILSKRDQDASYL